jgi:CheY-like chemotaxis protein
VQGDAHRVRQILLNLVGNATKFTHAGYIHVHLTVLERGGPQVRLLVEDTGIGIPLSKQSTIFEAFKQVDSSITRRYGGTGLGLTICKRLVELMRGEIDVRTRPGGGTVFEVTIPTSRSSPPEAPTVSRRSHELMVDTQLRDWHPYVLVADDDAVNQKVVRAFLVRLGARVDCVNDGSEAVQAVSRGCYDVVLMDCQMPIVDGMEATRRIRALDVEAHSVPIVALTANALDEVRERCACAGMNEFLSKPIQRNALREVLYRLMASREPIVHS